MAGTGGDSGGGASGPAGSGGGPAAVLAEILEAKAAEVEALKTGISLRELEAEVLQAEPPRNFFAAVTRAAKDRTAVIAEIKRKSPSAGWMRPEYEPAGPAGGAGAGSDPSSRAGSRAGSSAASPGGPGGGVSAGDGFDPVGIARAYSDAGASAISCLTDERFFGGSLGYIQRIKEAVPLPVLRKDFLIDPIQLWESRAAGADAVLLIAEALTEATLVDMLILAQQLRMTALVEVHDTESLLRVRPHIGFPHPTYCLLGINNRDLRTMTTDVSHTLRLVDLVDDPGVLVSESGIRTPEDLARLREVGVRIVLVGEHLMKQADPGVALGGLLGRADG